jgi:hypothetical protein
MGVTDPSNVSTLSSSAALLLRAEDLVGVTDGAACISKELRFWTGTESNAEVKSAVLGSIAAKNDSFLAFWPLDREGVLR